jgi:DNA-binding beta-propeller fold protein YncE
MSKTVRAFYLPMLAGLTQILSSCVPQSTDPQLNSQFFSGVHVIGTRGTGVGQFNKPRSVAVDSHDNLFVVDMTGRVQKFSSNGQFLLSWQMPQTDKGKPKGMCRDKEGNIIVLEPHYSRVNHFSPDGNLVQQWGTHGTNGGELAFPRAVAADSKGNLFVSEYGLTERVQGFSAAGRTLLASLGREGRGSGEFSRPEGLGLDRADRLYVADSCNHRIQVFSEDGKWLRSYGRAGMGPGELSYPYDVRVDADGYQYVCEFGNSRIQIFDVNGRTVEILGGTGAAPGKFSNPWSIALDSQGDLYVADAGNHRVQKFIRKRSVVGGQISVATALHNANATDHGRLTTGQSK